MDLLHIKMDVLTHAASNICFGLFEYDEIRISLHDFSIIDCNDVRASLDPTDIGTMNARFPV